MLAIIGGSGLTRLSTLAVARREVIRTPYGEPSSALVFGQIGGRDVVFLARHGQGHTIPPHRVNYRANLWALKKCGVASILAVASVGAVGGEYAVGDLVLPHQLIDYIFSTAAIVKSSTLTSRTPIPRNCGSDVSRQRARPAFPCTTPAFMRRFPVQGWKPRPRSIGSAAMAQPWSA